MLGQVPAKRETQLLGRQDTGILEGEIESIFQDDKVRVGSQAEPTGVRLRMGLLITTMVSICRSFCLSHQSSLGCRSTGAEHTHAPVMTILTVASFLEVPGAREHSVYLGRRLTWFCGFRKAT